MNDNGFFISDPSNFFIIRLNYFPIFNANKHILIIYYLCFC